MTWVEECAISLELFLHSPYIDDSIDYAENIDRLLRGEDTNTTE